MDEKRLFPNKAVSNRQVIEKTIPISLVEVDDNLGRLESVRVAPQRLVESIRENGLLHPIIVEPIARGGFRLIAGNKRLLALRELGEEVVRASVRTFENDLQRHAAAISENIVRDDFSLYEETMLVHRLVTKYHADPIDVARVLSQREGKIRAMLRAPEVLTKDQLEAFRKCKSRQVANMFLRAAEIRSAKERSKILDKPEKDIVVQVRRVREVVSFSDDVDGDVQIMFRGQALSNRERAMLSSHLQWVLRKLKDNPFTVRSQTPNPTEES